jgi:glycosyltransferase involved in cell wall biosynthesis
MISIVMPMRNAMPYLNECIESIINQTYTNWELVIVNDHSTDDSFEVLQNYINQDYRITVINATGKGIIDALRLAYSKTNGTYISRMDADDIMPPKKLELMRNKLIEFPNAVATGHIKYIGKNLRDGYKNYEIWMNTMMDDNSHYAQIYRECVIPSPAWMIKRELFDQIDGFNPNMYPEDYDLTLRMYEANIPVKAVKELVHIWRDYQERTSRNDPNYAFNTFEVLKTQYFLKINYDSTKTLVLWGGGKKGKNIAKLLIKHKIPFVFACNNHKKINQEIYGMNMENIETVFEKENQYQSIIAVANPDDQIEIKKTLKEKLGHVEAHWFC